MVDAGLIDDPIWQLTNKRIAESRSGITLVDSETIPFS